MKKIIIAIFFVLPFSINAQNSVSEVIDTIGQRNILRYFAVSNESGKVIARFFYNEKDRDNVSERATSFAARYTPTPIDPNDF